MDYQEALKKVQSSKTKENFLVITMGYDTKVCFSYKDGAAVLAALATAEVVHERYSEQHRIAPLDRNTIQIQVMSAEEYNQIKIAALLHISPDEVRQAAAEAEANKP